MMIVGFQCPEKMTRKDNCADALLEAKRSL
jgi:hypothetical protein